MGNDAATCKAIVIGGFKSKMFDGKVQTLTNVRHVPELKNNMISLEILGAAAWKFSWDDTTVKVIKGTIFAINGVRYTCILYKMIGGTMITCALIDTVKNSKSVLKKPDHKEKLMESLSFVQVLKNW